MKYIGIKLADNSFYPILEEGKPASKLLELTTAKDNQRIVQLDLYRSETASMQDAEYVDSLEIKDLKEHKNGEPTLALNISIDEHNKLNAELKDPETGMTSESAVTLVSRTLAERSSPTNFSLADENAPDTNEIEEDLSDLNAMDDLKLPEEETVPLTDSIDEDEAKADLDLPEIDVPVAETDGIADFSLPEEPMDFSLSDKELDSIESETNSFNSEAETADNQPEDSEVIGSEPNNEDFSFDDLTLDTPAEETSEKNEMEADAPADTDFSFDEAPEETPADTTVVEEPLPSMNFEQAVQADTLQNEQNSVLDLQDFENSPSSKETTTEEPDFSDLDSELPDLNETSSIDATSSLFNDSAYASTDASSDSLDIDSDMSDETQNSGLNSYFDDLNSDAFKTKDDDLDFDETPMTFDSTDALQDSASYDENDPFGDKKNSIDDLDLDGFGDSSSDSSSDSFSNDSSDSSMFDSDSDLGLSESEDSGSDSDGDKNKRRASVIICIICAIICIIGALLVLFVIPSKLNVKNLINKNNETTEANIEDVSSSETEEPEAVIEPEVPAVEDEVVIAATPEVVVPVKPEPAEEKPADITYKIKWGDTLWDIADAYYKNPWRYKTIARYNNIVNPDKIISGTTIKIPAE